MATRFRLSATVAADVTPLAISADWEHTSLAIVQKLTKTDENSTLTNNAATYDAADHLTDEDALHGQWVSDPLQAQTISAQTIKLQIKAAEATATNNVFIAWKAFLIDSSGAVVAGGTIVAHRRDNTEIATGAGANRGDSVTSSQVVAVNGDRICLELGVGGLSTAGAGTNGHNATTIIGETGASDLPEDDTTTTSLNPWLEFANDLAFGYKVEAASPAALTLTGFAPTITGPSSNTTVTPDIATIPTGNFAPKLVLTIVPATATLVTSLFTPAQGLGVTPDPAPFVNPPVTLTGFAPTVVAGSTTTVTPTTATALSLTGFAPNIGTVGAVVTPGVAGAVFAPTLAIRTQSWADAKDVMEGGDQIISISQRVSAETPLTPTSPSVLSALAELAAADEAEVPGLIKTWVLPAIEDLQMAIDNGLIPADVQNVSYNFEPGLTPTGDLGTTNAQKRASALAFIALAHSAGKTSRFGPTRTIFNNMKNDGTLDGVINGMGVPANAADGLAYQAQKQIPMDGVDATVAHIATIYSYMKALNSVCDLQVQTFTQQVLAQKIEFFYKARDVIDSGLIGPPYGEEDDVITGLRVPGGLTIIGFAPTVTTVTGNVTVSPENEEPFLNPFLPSLRETIAPANAELNIAKWPPNLRLTITPTTASLTVSTLTPQTGVGVNPSNAITSLTGNAPSLSEALTPANGAIVLTGNAPSLIEVIRLVPATANLVLTGFEPFMGGNVVVAPENAAPILTGFAPVLALTIAMDAPTQLVMVMLAPSLPTTLIPDPASILTSLFGPELRLSVTPGIATLTTSQFAPTVQHLLTLVPTNTALALTTFAPNLPGIATLVEPGQSSLVLARFTPLVLVSLPDTVTLSLTVAQKVELTVSRAMAVEIDLTVT